MLRHQQGKDSMMFWRWVVADEVMKPWGIPEHVMISVQTLKVHV